MGLAYKMVLDGRVYTVYLIRAERFNNAPDITEIVDREQGYGVYLATQVLTVVRRLEPQANPKATLQAVWHAIEEACPRQRAPVHLRPKAEEDPQQEPTDLPTGEWRDWAGAAADEGTRPRMPRARHAGSPGVDRTGACSRVEPGARGLVRGVVCMVLRQAVHIAHLL
jgi:hypothetical protein